MKEAFASNYVAPVGPMLDAFESEFISYTGIPYAVGLSAGTAALHLSVKCLDLSPGDHVWASSLTFIGSVSSLVHDRLEPIFLDCDLTSWTMDPELLAEALKQASFHNELPKAVIPTDLNGQSCDLDAIIYACKEYDVPVICDSAESLGAKYHGRQAGSGAYATAFSFNGNKIITTSGGGMLASFDKALIDRVRYYATQARQPAAHYEHTEAGFNYRLSNILAAIGRGQLEVLDERVARRREISALYETYLSKLPGISFMPEAPYGRSTKWLTTILVNPADFGCDREAIRIFLEAENIEARPLWKPMHKQPLFKDARMIGGTVSEHLFSRGLCLPSGTQMADADVERVAKLISSLHTK